MLAIHRASRLIFPEFAGYVFITFDPRLINNEESSKFQPDRLLSLLEQVFKIS